MTTPLPFDPERFLLDTVPYTVSGRYELRDGSIVEAEVADGRVTVRLDDLHEGHPSADGHWMSVVEEPDARFTRDAVRLVSIVPTGPGLYRCANGAEVDLRFRDGVGRWRRSFASTFVVDRYGQAFEIRYRARVPLPTNDIVSRIGDLPPTSDASPKAVAADEFVKVPVADLQDLQRRVFDLLAPQIPAPSR